MRVGECVGVSWPPLASFLDNSQNDNADEQADGAVNPGRVGGRRFVLRCRVESKNGGWGDIDCDGFLQNIADADLVCVGNFKGDSFDGLAGGELESNGGKVPLVEVAEDGFAWSARGIGFLVKDADGDCCGRACADICDGEGDALIAESLHDDGEVCLCPSEFDGECFFNGGWCSAGGGGAEINGTGTGGCVVCDFDAVVNDDLVFCICTAACAADLAVRAYWVRWGERVFLNEFELCVFRSGHADVFYFDPEVEGFAGIDRVGFIFE